MFESFLKTHPIKDRSELSEERKNAVRASINELIAKEEGSMIKHGRRLKPLIIAAAATLALTLSFVTVNAATKGGLVKFLFGGKEYEGDVYDYVDKDGYRNIGFTVALPTYEETYAFIIDIDAPPESRVRTLTEETDPEFFEKLCLYLEAMQNTPGGTNVTVPKPENFGLVCKPSELCEYNIGTLEHSASGGFGGEFMYTGKAYGHPSGNGYDHGDNSSHYGTHYDWDPETETYGDTKKFKWAIYYYVGRNDG